MLNNLHIPVAQNDDTSDYWSIITAVVIFIIVAMITLFGLTMLYSTSSGTVGATLFIKQFIWACVGSVAAIILILIGYKNISSFSMVFLVISAALLLVADFYFPAIKGAHRWIKIPGVGNIQPSEFAKIALVIFLAKYCSENMRYLDYIFKRKGLLPAVIVCGIMLGLIFLGKDWGTTFLLGSTAMIIFFAAGVRLRYLILPVILSPSLLWYLKHMDKERWSRLTTFLDPELYQNSDGYQLWLSLLALGSNGLGFTESRMKAKYLPEAHTDFILSIVGEELGFVFLCLVVLSYVLFVILGAMISIRAKSKQGMFLGIGITSLIGLQAFINIGVVSGMLPTKGMPAPFISYGGSNLVTCLCGVGILISIALESADIDLASSVPVVQRLKNKLFSSASLS